MTLTLPAYAKLNRDLRIIGRDAEGYHLISTVFETIGLHDTLSVRAVDGPLQVTCSDPALPTDGRNLVTRAVAGWCALHRGGVTDGLHLHVEKRIPMQAGLGGGSSDAATALIGLTMLERGFERSSEGRDALGDSDRELAASLGADVAFFLVGGRALGTGRGECLRPLADERSAPVVLAQPDVGVPTADAYRWFATGTGLRPGETLQRWADPGRASATTCTNDLQGAVTSRFPVIGRLIRALRRSGARQAAMTGSGSVVFGVFDLEGDAALAEAAVRQPGVRVWRTETLPRSACFR